MVAPCPHCLCLCGGTGGRFYVVYLCPFQTHQHLDSGIGPSQESPVLQRKKPHSGWLPRLTSPTAPYICGLSQVSIPSSFKKQSSNIPLRNMNAMSQPMIGELIPHPPSGTDPDWLLNISLPPGCVYWFRDGQVTQSEPMRHENIPRASGKERSALSYVEAWKRSSLFP